MKFSIRFADKIVGTLVIVGLAVLIAVIFMIGRSQRWFRHDYLYKTYYSSASGLSTGMPVQYMGFTIGHVKKIDLVADNKNVENDRVEVTFSIFEEYVHRVKAGSMVEIQESPIGLGNKFIFYSGKGLGPLDEGTEIPEYSSATAKENIARGLVERVGSTGDSINNILTELNDILASISKAVTGPPAQEYTNIEQIIMNLNAAIKNIEEAAAGLKDPLIYSELASSLYSLSGILDNLDKTSEFIPSNMPGLLIDLNAALRSAQDVLTALTNNPLLRGGVPEQRETSPGGAGSRNQEF